jgi:hypothetical protein
MSKLFTMITGGVLAVATWFLLFVILGIGLGTSFIAGGVVLAAGFLAAGMILATDRGAALDAPVTSVGLLTGVATFAVLEIVLSVPMWVGVVSALGTIGLYDLARANLVTLVRPALRRRPEAHRRARQRTARNGHGRLDREPTVTW